MIDSNIDKKISFAHLADLHLGGWREKRLSELNFKTFQIAIKKVIERKVKFVLFSGDLFNNALPPIELIEKVAKELLKLKENKIPLYVIGGSHDYSNSGKSFIKLLETVGVFIDVAKWEEVDKNEVKLIFTKNDDLKINLTGILGKKNGLDKNIYENLKELEVNRDYFNIFLFHTTLNDFKPDFMKAVKVETKSSYLPKNFDYYAGGHVHTYIEGNYNSGKLSYPGALFPNNFSEMKREVPSFNICEYDYRNRDTKIERVFINTYDKVYIKIEIDNLNSIEAKSKIEGELDKIKIEGKIILLEVFGLVNGKISDIAINKIISNLYEKGAFQILKNTYKLATVKLQKIEIKNTLNIENIEEEIIGKILSIQDDDNNSEKNEEGGNEDLLENITLSEDERIKAREDKSKLIKLLLKLNLSKQEGEKNFQYEERVVEAISKTLS